MFPTPDTRPPPEVPSRPPLGNGPLCDRSPHCRTPSQGMFISSFLKLYTAEIMESRIRSQILRAFTHAYYSVNVYERQVKN